MGGIGQMRTEGGGMKMGHFLRTSFMDDLLPILFIDYFYMYSPPLSKVHGGLCTALAKLKTGWQ